MAYQHADLDVLFTVGGEFRPVFGDFVGEGDFAGGGEVQEGEGDDVLGGGEDGAESCGGPGGGFGGGGVAAVEVDGGVPGDVDAE